MDKEIKTIKSIEDIKVKKVDNSFIITSFNLPTCDIYNEYNNRKLYKEFILLNKFNTKKGDEDV